MTPLAILPGMGGARNQRIADAFCMGVTIPTLAKSHGISNQRISQILRRFGLCRNDGGQYARACKQEAQRLDRSRMRIERRHLASYGCSADGAKWLGRSVRSAYLKQKRTASARGIDWQFDLLAWWKVWEESGKFDQRGRSGYCMGRFGDVGPYAPSNVYICTTSQNIHDYWDRKRSVRVLP